jgi:hypothetical protein
MFSTKFTRTAVLSTCLLTGLATSLAPHCGRQPSDRLALDGLQSGFHGAFTAADAGLMRSLWTKDAVFSGGGNVIEGRDKIVDFFQNGPGWGTTANLVPSYKSTFDIRGNEATIRFECVIVKVDGSSPLTTALSSLPPGSQNPKVEIIQHSNTTIEAVKHRGHWLIKSFIGKGGAIQ